MTIRLAPAQLLKLRSQQSHFEKVESCTGVPWEALAAIWYRESMSVASPVTLGGPFQFDPPPPPAHLLGLLHRFAPSLTDKEKHDLVSKGVNDFYAASYFAACHARAHCNPKITPNSPDEDIIDLFWGYNGKKFGNPRKSFYVYNGFDNNHMLRIKGTLPIVDKAGKVIGRKRIDKADPRAGAFVVYKQLKGEL